MSARTGWMLLLGGAVLTLMMCADAGAQKTTPKKQPGIIKGVITNNTLGLNGTKGGNEVCRITVTAANKDKGVLAITPQTKILRMEGDQRVAALPKDLTPGSSVAAKFAQPVLRSKPWQATALEVVILKQAK